MPSSTSNSDIYLTSRWIPSGPWLSPLISAVIALCAFIVFMEYRLEQRGFKPTIVDSDAQWLRQRKRASELGHNALILVGASRAQMDFDLSIFRQRTDLEPVQLALDGSSAIPVLRGLADDNRITGTIIFDFQPADINSPKAIGQSELFESEWDRQAKGVTLPNFWSAENVLTDSLHGVLRSYANGARPLTSLLVRIFNRNATHQYIQVLPTREGLADYQLVKMPNFYFQRVARDLEVEGGETVQLDSVTTWQQFADEFQNKVALLKPAVVEAFDTNTNVIGEMVRRIEKRGGKIIFMLMPTSGLVREITDRRYPRDLFWKRFVENTGAQAINSNDYAQLRIFECPDGSHLDYRDKARFTSALADILWPRQPR